MQSSQPTVNPSTLAQASTLLPPALLVFLRSLRLSPLATSFKSVLGAVCTQPAPSKLSRACNTHGTAKLC